MSEWSSVAAVRTSRPSDDDDLSDLVGHRTSWAAVRAPASDDEAPLPPPASPRASLSPIRTATTARPDDDDDADNADIVIRYNGPVASRKRGRYKISAAWDDTPARAPPPPLATAQVAKALPSELAIRPPMRVTQDCLLTLCRSSVAGIAPAHPLQASFRDLQTIVLSSGVESCPDVQKLADWKLTESEQCKPMLSLSAMSLVLELPAGIIKVDTLRLACIQLFINNSSRARFERAIVSVCRKSNLRAYLDVVRHDETPMPMRIVAQTTSAKGAPTAVGGEITDARSQAVLLLAGCLRRSCTAIESKLLQSEQRWAMLLKFGSTFVHFRGKTVCELLALENTKAETIAEAQAKVSQVSREVNAFERKTRIPCTDRASSNFDAERRVVDMRAHGWQSDHKCCLAHIKATLRNLSVGKM